MLILALALALFAPSPAIGLTQRQARQVVAVDLRGSGFEGYRLTARGIARFGFRGWGSWPDIAYTCTGTVRVALRRAVWSDDWACSLQTDAWLP